MSTGANIRQIDVPLTRELENAAAITDEDILEKVIAAANAAFADEDKDWGVAPAAQVRRAEYHAQ